MIQAAGVSAASDPRAFDPPGALVTPGTVSCDRLGGDYTVTWECYLVVGDHGTTEALNDLGDLFDLVRLPLGVGEARPMTLSLPNHAADPLPALQFTLTTSVDDTP